MVLCVFMYVFVNILKYAYTCTYNHDILNNYAGHTSNNYIVDMLMMAYNVYELTRCSWMYIGNLNLTDLFGITYLIYN